MTRSIAHNAPLPEIMKTDGTEILDTYESISTATAQMLAAARDARWEQLVVLGQDCDGLFERLLVLEDGAPRSREFQKRKAQLICRVLDCDAQIRKLIEPRLLELRGSLGDLTREKRLHNAYRGHLPAQTPP